LLHDPHPSKLWYPESHLEAFFNLNGEVDLVKGAFRHRSCKRFSVFVEPFPNLTYSIYELIVFESNCRLQVVQKELAIEKRGSRGIGASRQASYLSMLELSTYSRLLTKKHRREQKCH